MKFYVFYQSPNDGGGSVTSGVDTVNGAVTTPEQTPESTLPKTNEELQAYVSKHLEQHLTEKQKEWQAEQSAAIENAKKETERLAKLSSDEREKEILKLQTEAMSKKEAELLKKEMKFEAVRMLAEKSLSPNLSAMVCGNSIAETKVNISELEEHIKIEIEKAVTERLKSKSPEQSQSQMGTGNDFASIINQNKLR